VWLRSKTWGIASFLNVLGVMEGGGGGMTFVVYDYAYLGPLVLIIVSDKTKAHSFLLVPILHIMHLCYVIISTSPTSL